MTGICPERRVCISDHATPRFPLNGLLIHNKNHVSRLELRSVNLSGINKADFNGFVGLKYLELYSCQITAIGKDIFEEIGIIGDAPSVSGIFPHLETVYIVDHDIEQLDWAFLSPISRHLKVLNLDNNNLKSVTSTADSNSQVFLKSIEWLEWRGYKLSTVPRFIYESLNLNSLAYADFTGMRFCEKYVVQQTYQPAFQYLQRLYN
ncbi:hypothetical protein BV898_11548 [Hypsibius exemplaris]|uniref:Uncharacterized protein n=1 Tax=Hypsibius exemplaris TaxID=2072580 RepID=A0A1W0WG59_HYPEX|nr:hypothetical protein BV898_11548 [Hypsibius exemplaris]